MAPPTHDDLLEDFSRTDADSHRQSVMDILHAALSHRKSWGGDRTPTKGSPKAGPAKPARLDIEIESPPLVCHGPPSSSSGALLSGQLILHVTDPDVRLESFSMQLLAKMTVKKPVHKDCKDCQAQSTELKQWIFLSEPAVFKKGDHKFPFSFLLPGHLPATTHGQLGTVDYVLSAVATTPLESIGRVHDVKLGRALQPPPVDRTSIRIFPPTILKVELAHPPIIHPIGEFSVHLRLTGVTQNEPSLLRRWRVRKMSWRVDEQSQMISPACAKHAPKLGGEGKGVLHTDTKPVGAKDIKEGWKSDFDQGDGITEVEFPVSLRPGFHPTCDVENPTGMQVTHKLSVELVVAEEVAPAKSPKQMNASGTARVLRMQFPLVVTERAGLGVSWDEEQPPVYEDVPSSPPCYASMHDYVGEEIPANDRDLAR